MISIDLSVNHGATGLVDLHSTIGLSSSPESHQGDGLSRTVDGLNALDRKKWKLNGGVEVMSAQDLGWLTAGVVALSALGHDEST